MRSYPSNRYVPGSVKRQCDRCGFDFLDSQLKKEWTGHLVCKECWEPVPYDRVPRPKIIDHDDKHFYKIPEN